MRNLKDKKTFYEIMQSRPALVFLGIVLVVFMFSIASFVGKMRDTSKNRQIVEDKIKLLEQAKVELTANIESLQTDKGKEESIREKFGFAKEGEGMIVIVDEKESSENNKTKNEKGFFNWLKKIFK